MDANYNPWLNGDASWVDGKHDNGIVKVTIDTRLSVVDIDYSNNNGYNLQGNDADEFIKAVCWRATHERPSLSYSANVTDYVMENYF